MRARVLILALVVASALPLAGQTYATITGSNIPDASGGPLQSGNLCFGPVDNSGAPIAFRTTGQTVMTPACVPVVNGVITPTGSSFQLADTRYTYPANVCYWATLVDNSNGSAVYPPKGYTCVQMSSSWCTTTGGVTTCDWDNYPPNSPTQAPIAAPALAAGTITTLPAGSPATASVSGSAPDYTLNLGIPQGAAGLGTDPNCHTDGSGNLTCGTVSAGQAVVGGVQRIALNCNSSTNNQAAVQAAITAYQTVEFVPNGTGSCLVVPYPNSTAAKTIVALVPSGHSYSFAQGVVLKIANNVGPYDAIFYSLSCVQCSVSGPGVIDSNIANNPISNSTEISTHPRDEIWYAYAAQSTVRDLTIQNTSSLNQVILTQGGGSTPGYQNNISNVQVLNAGDDPNHVVHDMSSLFEYGDQATIQGNRMTASATNGGQYNAPGANTAIEAHGSQISTTGNTVVGYAHCAIYGSEYPTAQVDSVISSNACATSSGGIDIWTSAFGPATTATWSAGASTVTVTSSSGITAGQYVTAYGVPTGCTVASLSGPTVTLGGTPIGGGSCVTAFAQSTAAYITFNAMPFGVQNLTVKGNTVTVHQMVPTVAPHSATGIIFDASSVLPADHVAIDDNVVTFDPETTLRNPAGNYETTGIGAQYNSNGTFLLTNISSKLNTIKYAPANAIAYRSAGGSNIESSDDTVIDAGMSQDTSIPSYQKVPFALWGVSGSSCWLNPKVNDLHVTDDLATSVISNLISAYQPTSGCPGDGNSHLEVYNPTLNISDSTHTSWAGYLHLATNNTLPLLRMVTSLPWTSPGYNIKNGSQVWDKTASKIYQWSADGTVADTGTPVTSNNALPTVLQSDPQNGSIMYEVQNTGSGAAASAGFDMNNGTSNGNFVKLGANYTVSGLLCPDCTALYDDGAHGISIWADNSAAAMHLAAGGRASDDIRLPSGSSSGVQFPWNTCGGLGGTATMSSTGMLGCASSTASGQITIASSGTTGTFSTSASYCAFSPANNTAATDLKANGAYGPAPSGGTFTLTLGAAATGSDVFNVLCK